MPSLPTSCRAAFGGLPTTLVSSGGASPIARAGATAAGYEARSSSPACHLHAIPSTTLRFVTVNHGHSRPFDLGVLYDRCTAARMVRMGSSVRFRWRAPRQSAGQRRYCSCMRREEADRRPWALVPRRRRRRSGTGRQTPVIGWPQRGYPPPTATCVRLATRRSAPGGVAVPAAWADPALVSPRIHDDAGPPDLALMAANDQGVDWIPRLITQAQTSPGVVHRPVDR